MTRLSRSMSLYSTILATLQPSNPAGLCGCTRSFLIPRIRSSSARPNPALLAGVLSTTFSNSSAFSSSIAAIRSSMESRTTNRTTCSGSPRSKRCALYIAWFSTAGFHHRSKQYRVRGLAEIQSYASRAERDQQRPRSVTGPEPLHHCLSSREVHRPHKQFVLYRQTLGYPIQRPHELGKHDDAGRFPPQTQPPSRVPPVLTKFRSLRPSCRSPSVW